MIDETIYVPTVPKNTKQLKTEISTAIQAIRDWLWASQVDPESFVLIDPQIEWLEDLLKIADIELNKEAVKHVKSTETL